MNLSDYPTKNNLIQARLGLRLAQQGYVLMDKKQQVLLKQLRDEKKVFAVIQAQVGEFIQHAYAALGAAYMDVGMATVEKYRMEEVYPLYVTSTSMDEARKTWCAAKQILLAFAEAQARVDALAQGVRKAQKRAAALQHKVIPTYEARIRTISTQLEERGRDERVRLLV